MRKAIIILIVSMTLNCPQKYYKRNCSEVLNSYLLTIVIATQSLENSSDNKKRNNSELPVLASLAVYKSCTDSEPNDPIYNFLNKQ
jgi:hypothetical protein